MNYIQYKQTDHIGLLLICRPKALNALNTELLQELAEKLDELAQSDLRALVISGAGEKAFIAGADIEEMRALSQVQAEQFSLYGGAVMRQIEAFPAPVIAAVNGYALGGGCEVALSCDVRLAAEEAVFGFPETSLGIIPGYGGMQRLLGLVGEGKAKMLVFTAGRIPAEEALRLGLVEMVVPLEHLLDEALKLAQKIATNAPLAVRAAKEVLNMSVGLSLESRLGLEKSAFASCFETQDQMSAMTAFLSGKKSGPFTGT